MKIRIHHNTLRVRLTQSEVKRLGAGEKVEQTTTFAPGSVLTSSIESAGVPVTTVTFAEGNLAVRVPRPRVAKWAASDEVGIDAIQSTGDDELRILIEKDFKCLHGEAEADAFPNPNE